MADKAANGLAVQTAAGMAAGDLFLTHDISEALPDKLKSITQTEMLLLFASAAQGTLADSALQSADIDTLAELNAIVGDATLIDTGDSRLSDARTPTAHALGGAEHSADTLANLNTKVSDATLIDTGDSRLSDARTPTAHDLGGAEHNADTLANLNLKVSDATLIDTGDSRLSDARTPTAHALGGAEHSADTLANLNTKVSDATLIDTGDSRLSDSRAPTNHASDHTDGTDDIQLATTTQKGLVEELATAAELSTGTDPSRVPPVSAIPIQIQDSKYVFAADGEASDTYVITLVPAPAAYATGQVFHFTANTVNTGAATLNVNGLGALAILKNHDVVLVDGDIEAGQAVTVIHDGTQFQMQSQLGNAAAGGGGGANVGASAADTIVTGVLTITDQQVVVSGEGASDDTLVTISGLSDGDLLVMRPAGETITIENATDNIFTSDGADLIMETGSGINVVFVKDGANFKEVTDPRSTIFGVKGGEVWTGIHTFGTATSLAIPFSAAPTVDADGEVAVDTTVTDFSHGVMKYFGGEEMGVVAMPIAEFTSPTAGDFPSYNATNDEFEMTAAPAAIQHFDDFSLPAGGWRASNTNGAAPADVEDFDALAFDASTEESATFQFRLPEDYAGGTIKFSVDWDAVATASGTAVFGLSARAYADSDPLNAALGSEITVTDTLNAVEDQNKSPNSAALTIAGTPVAGELCKFKIAVKTSGTIAVDVLLLNVQIQYQTATTQPAEF